jgi:hypothetical protein
MFCVVQAGSIGADGYSITVTVFRVIDSEMPVTLVERRRCQHRERGMNARWVVAELERACADKASGSGRRRKLCRVNLSHVHCARRRRSLSISSWGALDVELLSVFSGGLGSTLRVGEFD